MYNKELEQKFPDGKTRTIGTNEYEEAYYALGENGAFGDLGSVGAPFTILRLGLTVQEDQINTAHIKSYLRILKMIAQRDDDKYSIRTRKTVSGILKPYQDKIDNALTEEVIRVEQLKNLLPISLQWNDFALLKMDGG